MLGVRGGGGGGGRTRQAVLVKSKTNYKTLCYVLYPKD